MDISYILQILNHGYIRKSVMRRRNTMTYLALPRKVVLLLPASVQWDEKVATRVAVLNRQTSIGHLLAGG